MYSMQTLGVSLTVGVQDIADRSLAHRHKLRGCTDTKTHGCINTQGAQFIGQVNQRQKKIPQAFRLGGLLGIGLLFVLFVEVNHINSVVALANNAVKLC